MNANTNVIIREGTIAECIEISEKYPNFRAVITTKQHTSNDYQTRNT